MHTVAVLAHPGMAPFETGVAAEVFAIDRPELDVGWWYRFALCARVPGPQDAVGGLQIVAPHGLGVLARADTVIVPGTEDVHGDPHPDVVAALRRAHGGGARIVSICSGAFVLAAAGLLDGRRAATHWRYAELLARRYPAVRVDGGVLYVDDGDVLSSAGTAAGIDLCLHLVRRDHGADVANRVARRMVVAPHRDGGQAQFVERPVASARADDPIARTMAWALERLGEPLSVTRLAREAHLAPRSYTRRFAAATGTSPGRWLLEQRVAAGAALLESSDDPVEDVGALVGLPSPAAFRRHFARTLGVAPSAYRRRFRAADARRAAGGRRG